MMYSSELFVVTIIASNPLLSTFVRTFLMYVLSFLFVFFFFKIPVLNMDTIGQEYDKLNSVVFFFFFTEKKVLRTNTLLISLTLSELCFYSF